MHVHQATRVDEEVVDEVATVAAERGFEAATLATTGIVTEEARGTAEAAGVSAIDGDALSGLAGSADIEATGDAGTASSLAEQFAGHWPGPMRERAVEAADAVDGVAEFDRDVTRATGLTDLDFHHGDPEEPVVRLRFTGTSFLVYVRGQDDLESVVRLSAYRVHQPPLPADLTDRIRSALGTGSD